MKKNNVVMAVLAILIMICMTGCGKTVTVDLNSCISCEFEGYDGYGNLRYVFDRDVVKNAIRSNMTEDEYMKFTFFNSIDIDGKWSKTEDLSNGEKVTFVWNIDKEDVKRYKEKYNVKLKYSDITQSVSGLKDASSFDMREYIKVTFDGVSPNGKASASCDIYGIVAKLDVSSGLSNGDTVVVTLSTLYMDDTIESICRKNKIPVIQNCDFEYKVEGLKSYVTKVEEIPERVVEIMKKKSEESIMKYHEDENECEDYDRDFNWFFPYYEHNDFNNLTFQDMIVKPATDGESNVVYLIYKAVYTDHGERNAYFVTYVSGVVDSVEGLTENDIYVLIAYPNTFMVNEDTVCKMRGMSESGHKLYLEENGVKY